MAEPRPADQTIEPSLAIRPPLQRRTREQWLRVLDAGVAILEEHGYEGFTIAAVCDRAKVAPRAIYARADTKDALFLAVYDHGMARIGDDRAALSESARWQRLPPPDLIDAAVREIVGLYIRHSSLLRAVVLISGVHPEVRKRGSQHVRALGTEFCALVLRARDHIQHPDPEAATWSAFAMVVSALSLRIAYGPGFAAPATDDNRFADTMSTMVRRYLLER